VNSVDRVPRNPQRQPQVLLERTPGRLEVEFRQWRVVRPDHDVIDRPIELAEESLEGVGVGRAMAALLRAVSESHARCSRS
jgi:hypothetical protein